MIKTLENLDAYRTGMRGSPRLHEEMAWYATEDDRVLGIIVRNRIDDDYGWVVLCRATEWENVFLTDIPTPMSIAGST
jgi:hypothetical protein